MSAPESQGGNQVPTFRSDADGDLFSRIDEAVTLIGSSKLAADAVGVSVDTVARWRKGPTMPPFDKIAALCRVAGFHVDWIATGEGPRDISPSNGLAASVKEQRRTGGGLMQIRGMQHDDQDMVLLPRLSVEASAGQGLVPADEEIEEFLAFKADFLRHLGVDPRNAHVLRIKGNSMYPTLRDRDVIVIDAALIEVLEEGVYTLVYDGAVFAKRLQPLRDGSVVISSDNKEEGWRDETVPRSERHTLNIVGRIRGVYRDL